MKNMKILYSQYTLSPYKPKPGKHTPNYVLKPLNQDTVSFGRNQNKNAGFVKKREEFINQLKKDKKIPAEDIKNLAEFLEEDTIEFAKELYNDKNFPVQEVCSTIGDINGFPQLKKAAKDGYKHYAKIYNQCIKNPDNYITITYQDPVSNVMEFFDTNNKRILELCGLCDDELNDIIFRKRFNQCQEYLRIIDSIFKSEKYEILKKSLQCKKANGSPLSPKEKLQIPELIEGYTLTHASFSMFKKMADSGTIDITGLKKNLLSEIMQYCGYDKKELAEIPTKQLLKWDNEFVYKLPKQLKYNKADFQQIIKMANEGDFKKQLHDVLTSYGLANYKTGKQFKNFGLNYKKWLNPSNKNNIHIKLTDKNSDKLKVIAENFLENIEDLRQTPVKTFIDKKYKKHIKDDKFILQNNERIGKNELKIFMQNFEKELKPVWERAEAGALSTNLEIKTKALHTLTVRSHFQTLLDSIDDIQESDYMNNIDLTIKMWDRVPQHDLFQGNYSTCCIGIGQSNGLYMPTYLLNTAFNMIELVDNISGKTVGNALCYYGFDSNKELVFIIDNVEINNSYTPSYDTLKIIRQGIKDYATNINKEIAPYKEIPIYLGPNYNDIPTGDLDEIEDEFVTFIGKIDNRNCYLDAFNGYVSTDWLRDNITLKVL